MKTSQHSAVDETCGVDTELRRHLLQDSVEDKEESLGAYTPVSEAPSRQHLRSVRRHQLSVPSVHRSTYGSRGLSVAGPTVCNSLPL